jgi:hypothetical protein
MGGVEVPLLPQTVRVSHRWSEEHDISRRSNHARIGSHSCQPEETRSLTLSGPLAAEVELRARLLSTASETNIPIGATQGPTANLQGFF